MTGLVAEVAVTYTDGRLREAFGFTRLREGVYTSSQMDTKWTDGIERDYACWLSGRTHAERDNILWGVGSETGE